MSQGIYEIVNVIDGKRYVGSSTNIDRRWRCHKKDLRNSRHHSAYLQRAWVKHGESVFSFCVIENCEKASLIEREQHYFDALRPEYWDRKAARHVSI